MGVGGGLWFCSWRMGTIIETREEIHPALWLGAHGSRAIHHAHTLSALFKIHVVCQSCDSFPLHYKPSLDKLCVSASYLTDMRMSVIHYVMLRSILRGYSLTVDYRSTLSNV